MTHVQSPTSRKPIYLANRMTLERALERIAELEETIHQLKTERGDDMFLPNAFRVQKHAATLLRLLIQRGKVSRRFALERMYKFTEPPDTAAKVLDTVAYRLRWKMRPFGITILRDYGAGYSISAEDQAKLKRLCETLT